MVGRVVLLSVLALAFGRGPAAARQGRLHAGEFHARYDRAAAQIRLRYEVARDAADAVPLSLLAFRGSIVDSIRVRVDAGAAQPLVLAAERGGRLRGSVPLGDPAPQRVTLEIEYAIRSTAGRRVTLPVVAVMWPPAQARPGLFTGEVLLAGQQEAYNAFPATLRARGVQGDARTYTFSLPVLPAVVSFDVAADAPALTFTRTLDLLVVLLTILFCAMLWRQFRAQPTA